LLFLQMPYIPTRSGQSVFIQDPNEAQQRYQQEWGQGATPQMGGTTPKPTAKPQAQAKPQRQPKRGFDLGRFIQDQAGGALKRAGTAAATQFLAGPLAPLVQPFMAVKGAAKAKIPGTQQTIGDEARRIVQDIPRQIVNAPIAAMEQIGAVTQGVDLGAALAGGGSVGAMGETDKALVEQRSKNAQAAIEALQKTGRDPQGFSYGIKPKTPIIGPAFSDDSEFVKQNIKPKTAGGRLVSQIGAAIGFDLGVNKLTKAPSLMGQTIQTAEKFSDVWKNKDLAKGAQVMASYLIKDVLPESIQSAMFFMPQPPAAMQKELDEIQNLRTPEERIRAAEVLRAENPDKFNYALGLLKEASFGVGTVTGIRGVLYLGNRFLSKATSGIPAQQAMEEATQEALPLIRQEVEAEGVKKANEVIQDRLGAVTSELYKKIDENVAQIAFGARAGAESFLQRQQELIPDFQRLTQELEAVPPVGPERASVAAEIDSLRSVLGVNTPEQVAAKQANLEARLMAYEEAIAKDPEWINKSTGVGKKASKNSTKVRMAAQAAERLDRLRILQTQLQEFDNLDLERTAKIAQLEEKVVEGQTSSIAFTNSLNDARILVDTLDKLNDERIGYLESYNALLFRENRLDEIDTDYTLKDAFGQAYGELKDLLNAGEAAVASGNLNPQFINTFINRVDEIHNKVIDNGGLAPVVPQIPEDLQQTMAQGITPDLEEAIKPPASLVIPKPDAPVVNQVPVTKTDDGEIVVDTDTIGANRALSESVPGDDIAVNPREVIREVNRDLEINQDPSETFENLKDFTKGYEDALKEQKRLIDKTGDEDIADKAFQIYNTSATKYTGSFDNAAAVKALFETFDRDAILPQQYGLAIRKLAEFMGGDSRLNQLAEFISAEQVGKDIQKNLNKIMVPTATLDSNASAALAAARDLRKIMNDEDIPGLDRVTALDNFKTNFQVFVANAKALNEMMYGVGNALRLFDRRNRLQFAAGDPKVLFSRFNQELATFGDNQNFADVLADKTKAAKAELEEHYGDLFKKISDDEDLTDDDLAGLESLVEKIYESQGDISKLKDLEVTADAVLARLQIGSPLSNPATVFSIPIQGIPETYLELTGQTVSNTITGTMAKWLGKTEFAKESLDEARIAADTILQTRFVLGEALEATYNRFVYGKAISDPAQAADSAYEIQRAGGLRREEAIAQDLAQKQVRIPFVNYVMERGENDDKLFDTVNGSRVFLKAFHDYFMPAEAWEKRSWFGKYVMGGTTTALRGMGLGKKSYYPGGENVNLSLPMQLSAAADELTTALFANAHVRAVVNKEVDEQIAAGVVASADRAEEIARRLNKEMSDVYKPVKVGFDQQTIGYSVLDNQILQMTRAINLTEELTGPLANTADAVNALRNSKHPALAAFGRDIFPFLTSPLNGIKRAAMIAYGGEVVQAGVDAFRAGFSTGMKALPESIADRLPAKTRQDIIDFESKYVSSDPQIRSRAQGALALSLGINALAFFLLRDGNQDLTGGLENTYRETEGVRDPYTWKVGGMMIPYRYLPVIGNTLAFHATIRDLQEFSPGRETSGAFALAIASLANTILETPAIAGFDRVIKALTAAGTGDVSRMQKLIADSVAKVSDPYLNLRKVVIQGFDPRKPASPVTRFADKGFYSTGKLGEKGITMSDIGNSILDSSFGSFGIASEYSPVGVIADALVSVVRNEPEFRTASRKALWYGKPGTTINANHAGKWYPVQAVLGRYWLFPDKLGEDPVANEMVVNLISPPRKTLFSADGVGINEAVLNDFNHFLNSEFEYYDPVFNKQYKGAHAYLKDLVNSKQYKQYPSVDSPFRMGSMGLVQDPNWGREDNMRRVILKNEVDKLISIAKEQFLMGDLPGQRYKAPAEMKQLVLQNRLTGGAQ